MRDGFRLRKLKKVKQDWGGRIGSERTRWVMWGLRLERREGEEVLRCWRPESARVLAIV